MAAGLAFAFRLAKGGGDRPTAICAAAAALFGALLLIRMQPQRPYDAVVIIDRPDSTTGEQELSEITDSLGNTGCKQLGLVVIDPDTSERPLSTFVDAKRTDAAAALLARPAVTATPADALRLALDNLKPMGWFSGLMGVIRGRGARIVVGVSDERPWRGRWEPLDVDDRLAEALEAEVVVDRVSLGPREITAELQIRAPLGVIADWELSASPVALTVVIDSPDLKEIANQVPGTQATISIDGRLDNGTARLQSWKPDVHPRVLSTGEIVVHVPLNAFQVTGGGPLKFDSGFVRCAMEVSVAVDMRTFKASATVYLPVRRFRVLIACGPGAGSMQLLTPSLLESATEDPDPVTRLERRAATLGSDRARLAAAYQFIASNTLASRFTGDAEQPNLLVLHACGPEVWKNASLVELIDQAVEDGMHLAVVDPPTRPADPTEAASLDSLLPAFAQSESRFGVDTGLPNTVDRTPVLNLVFAAGRWGRFQETPGQAGSRTPMLPALDAQKAAANAVLAQLNAAGMTFGQIEYDDADHTRLVYRKHATSSDRVLVRVAPMLQADGRLTDTLFSGALELSVAAGFADAIPALVDSTTGLTPNPAPAPYPFGDPSYTPNMALVAFVGDVPQPLPGPLSAAVPYSIGASAGRSCAVAPQRVLARLLRQGVATAVIRCDLPSYKVGLFDMATSWPGPSPNPLETFVATPQQVLDLTVANLDSVAGDWWLDASQAALRLKRDSTGSVFYGTMNLEQPAACLSQAQLLGTNLGTELIPLFRSPREKVALAVTEHGSVIDERIGPGRPARELAPGSSVATAWPEAERRTAPRRFRGLTISNRWGDESRAVLSHAVEFGPTGATPNPWPLTIGGFRGPALVVCVAYSPFETAETWRPIVDRICTYPEPDAPADWHGVDFLIGLSTFAGRLRNEPFERPRLRTVCVGEAQNGCDLVVDFTPQHTQHEDFWSPQVTVPGAAVSAGLELVTVDWPSRSAVFRLSSDAASALCGNSPGATVRTILNGKEDPASQFYLPRPGNLDWKDLTALESIDLLASLSGGMVGPPASLASLARSARVTLLLLLTSSVLGVALSRGRYRWMQWIRALSRRRNETRPRLVNAEGLGDEYGERMAPYRPGRKGPLESRGPLGPGGRLEHVRRQSQVRFFLGIPGIPEVDLRRPLRVVRLDIIIDLGESMRACVDRYRDPIKIRFAASIAELLAALYAQSGASVRLIATGLKGGPQELCSVFGRGRAGHFVQLATTATRESAAYSDPQAFASIRSEPGATVIWLSDFLYESTPAGKSQRPPLVDMLNWGACLADSDGMFGAIHIAVPEEFEKIGLGMSRQPFVLLDRLGLSPEDMRRATRRHVDALTKAFAHRGLAFAALTAESAGSETVESLERGGLLDGMQ
ncbi:MAG TPA: hypothetical protein VHC22_10955 [Pirellulales bacterium]|nr:hypothetical protein [Pirellulales bacterium]